MITERIKQLHQKVIDATSNSKRIIKDHQNKEEEIPTSGEKFSDIVFRIGSRWSTVILFMSFVILWVVFNICAPSKYCFDPFPFLLLTFMLAAIAAMQAPIIMMSQHRQEQKRSKPIAVNLKVENEILSIHQTIIVTMEKQIQQVLENQATTLKLLNELQAKNEKGDTNTV